jgi:acyl-CoA reductase-like NAD-dependent aldehyde dehydrogenase
MQAIVLRSSYLSVAYNLYEAKIMPELFMNFVGGNWLAGSEVSRNVNPSDTDDVIGEYSQADAAQVEAAVSAAKAAAPAWSLSTPQTRHDCLKNFGRNYRSP